MSPHDDANRELIELLREGLPAAAQATPAPQPAPDPAPQDAPPTPAR
ncbi:hypothetical protein [Deinococcus radiotolerans]|nr:hypothetical protein [Deinococcus radiotolerans]